MNNSATPLRMEKNKMGQKTRHNFKYIDIYTYIYIIKYMRETTQ